MKAITLWQPMAHAVIYLEKTTENRPKLGPWMTAVGSTVAIHAGRPATWSAEHAEIIEEITGVHLADCDVDFSAIIGTAFIDDAHWAADRCCDDGWAWNTGAHLSIAYARPCPPIPCRGALGLWTVPRDVELELLDAVRR